MTMFLGVEGSCFVDWDTNASAGGPELGKSPEGRFRRPMWIGSSLVDDFRHWTEMRSSWCASRGWERCSFLDMPVAA
jgi:hypothetical protein